MIKDVEPVVKSLFIIGAGSNHPHALSQSTFHKPAILREWDTKNQKQKTDMKKLIVKLLGLESLVSELNTLKNEVLVLADENKELKAELAKVSDSVEAIEDFDADDFVREDDVNDRIESYLNDNDYVSSSYVDDEIETKVSEAVESAIDDLDIEDKVKDVVSEMDKASFGDTEEIEQAVSKAVAEVLSKAYNALKKGL